MNTAMASMYGVLSGEVRRHVTFGAGRYRPHKDVCQNGRHGEAGRR